MDREGDRLDLSERLVLDLHRREASRHAHCHRLGKRGRFQRNVAASGEDLSLVLHDLARQVRDLQVLQHDHVHPVGAEVVDHVLPVLGQRGQELRQRAGLRLSAEAQPVFRGVEVGDGVGAEISLEHEQVRAAATGQQIVAALALQPVAARAGLDRVVAAPAVEPVETLAPAQEVLAPAAGEIVAPGAAVEHVGPGTAAQRVLAIAAGQGVVVAAALETVVADPAQQQVRPIGAGDAHAPLRRVQLVERAAHVAGGRVHVVPAPRYCVILAVILDAPGIVGLAEVPVDEVQRFAGDPPPPAVGFLAVRVLHEPEPQLAAADADHGVVLGRVGQGGQVPVVLAGLDLRGMGVRLVPGEFLAEPDGHVEVVLERSHGDVDGGHGRSPRVQPQRPGAATSHARCRRRAEHKPAGRAPADH